MTQPACDCCLLSATAAKALTAGSIGKLAPTLSQDDPALPFTALDCFDQSLRQSDRLLLDSADRLDLLLPDGQILSQPAGRKGQFVADFAPGAVKQALADLSPLRSLLPLGTGTCQRATLAFLDDDRKTHCRAHLLYLTGSGGKTSVLATLQGLRGYDKALADLRKLVLTCGGTAFDMARLRARLLSGKAAYDAKPRIVIAAKHSAFQAANAIIAAYIPVARANEAGIIADHDTEFLHDYRIALRKIRSVLSLFKGVYPEDQIATLKARFSALMEPTGRLRDLDVYLLEKDEYYNLLPKSLHSGLDLKFDMLAKERKLEKARLARHFRSTPYAQEMTALEQLFAKRHRLKPGPTASLAASDYACALIWKRYRKICGIAAGIGPDTDDAEVHELRIHCKKLRYLMEFFAPLFTGPEFRAVLKSLKGLQDNLGLINDYAVQQVNLQEFVRGVGKWPDGVDVEVAQSVGALVAVLHRRQAEERARTVDSFVRFNSPETQQAFRDLFHARKEKP